MYMAYLEAKYFNLNEVVRLMKIYPDILGEEMILKGYFKKSSLGEKNQFIQMVAAARYTASKLLHEIPVGTRCPLEFFLDKNNIQLNVWNRSIIEEYRNKKKMAYALLYK